MSRQGQGFSHQRRQLVKGAVLAGAAVSFLAASPALGAVRLDENERQRIGRLVSSLIDRGEAPGVSVTVMIDDEVVHSEGYGFANLETRTPVTAGTVFRIGSITKQLTAASIMMLAEEKKLSLADPLSKHLPDFPGGDRVTLRQLLENTSGIRDIVGSAGHDYESADRSVDSIVADIAAQKPLYDFAPGTRWRYSNSGFMILGKIIQDLSGESFADFLKTRISDRLDLKTLAVDTASDIVPERASGYVVSGKGYANAPYLSMSVPGAAGAARANSSDVAKWHSSLFAHKVVSKTSLAEMISPAKLNGGALTSTTRVGDRLALSPSGKIAEYGLGLTLGELDGHPRIGHRGSINGFNSDVSTYPDVKVTVAVLANAREAASTLAPEIARIAIAAVRR